MSVYISGMEMPTRCYACPCADLEYYDCNLMPGTRIEQHKRLDDCPLVPVPPHGPLVDALDVINAFPDVFVFTNEQARALTNYIIPADPAKEGE